MCVWETLGVSMFVFVCVFFFIFFLRTLKRAEELKLLLEYQLYRNQRGIEVKRQQSKLLCIKKTYITHTHTNTQQKPFYTCF